MIYLCEFLAIFLALVVVLLSQSAEVDADTNDHLYNSIFRYRSKKRNLSFTIDALNALNATQTGLSMIDPRRAQVSFWLEAAENNQSKCSKRQDQIVLSMLQQDKLIAEHEKKKGRVLNLEAYVDYVRSRTLVYCAYTIGVSFVSELDSVLERFGDDLFDLQSDQLPDDLDANEIGERVGHLLLSRLDQTSLVELGQSLEDTQSIREHYQQHSPCSGIFRVLARYEDYYGLLTAEGNYEKSKSELRNAINQIFVCKFIDEHSFQVFEAAADYLHHNLLSRSRSSVRAQSNDDRYNSIFKFSHQPRTVEYIKMALAELDSYRSGLTPGDPRREEVSFWINAALNDDSKCNIEDDTNMRSHLEQIRSRGLRSRRVEEFGGRVLNLYAYFESIRSDRLLYCDSRFGQSFVSKLTQLNKSNYIDICLLSRGFRHSSEKDAQELAKRVGELLLRRSDQEDQGKLRQSEASPGLIRGLYAKYSPCAGLLECAEEYKGYMSLISMPRNYLKVRPVLRNWIDKISVCRFINQSEEVFSAAADSIRGER